MAKSPPVRRRTATLRNRFLGRLQGADKPRRSGIATREKSTTVVLMAMGGAGLAGGATAVAFDDDLPRFSSIPLFTVGALQLLVGATTYLGVGKRVASLTQQLHGDPEALADEELPRINGVRRTLVALLIFEGLLIAGGTATAVTGFVRDSGVAQGVGLGIAGEALITMVWDAFAHARAVRYGGALDSFRIGLSASRGGAGVGARWSF